MTLYRGVVVAVLAGGPVVRIPRLYGAQHPGVGPLPTLVGGLLAGDRVVVADELDGRSDCLIVGRVA